MSSLWPTARPTRATAFIRHASRIAGLLLLVCAAGRAAAGPPYVTDDPEPVEYQHYEIFLASIYQRVGGVASGTLPHVEVNYGPLPNVQVALYVPAAFSTDPGAPMLYGPGDTEIGLKYRFIQETKTAPMVSIYPQVVLPSGNAERGLGAGHVQALLPIWVQKSWGAWTTYGGAGYWSNPGYGNHNYCQLGWLVQKDLNRRWTLGTEVYYFSSAAVGVPEQLNFNIGGQYNFDEGHHLVFAFGRSISGTTSFMSYIGHQWTFGPRAKDSDTSETHSQ
jgi:hypothetical protein